MPELTADPPADKSPRAGRSQTTLLRATANIKAQRWADARELLLQVLKDTPRDATALYYLGLSYEGLGERGAAKDAYTRAMDADPGASEAAANLGAMLLEDPKEVDAAIAAMRPVAERRPDATALWRNLGVAYAQKRDVPSAVRFYEGALKTGEDGATRLALGQLLVEAKQYDKAKPHLLRSLELVGEDAATLAELGMLLGYAKAYGPCLQAYNRALKAGSPSAEWLTRRGTCKHGLGDEPGAQSDFAEATKADPRFAAAHYYLGESFMLERKRGRAFDAFEQASALDKTGAVGRAAREQLKKLDDVARMRKDR